MLGFAWLALRQADEALKTGRLEEAYRLLGQPAAQGHKRAWEMLQQVAEGFVERGEQRLRHADHEAAWHDLLQAEQMGRAESDAGRLRQGLVQAEIAAARTLLQAGEPGRAAETLDLLRQRSARQPEVQLLEAAARGWLLAREQAARGEFPQAIESLSQVRRLLGDSCPVLDRYQEQMGERRQTFAFLLVQLHQVLEGRRWQDVVRIAEQILAVAPHHEEARKARSRAWKTIEPVTVVLANPSSTVPSSIRDKGERSQRFLLWVDGVGGYLVCLGARVTLGQATPDASIDIPLYADVSRWHATISRDAEGYLLEAVRPLLVNGRPAQKALLHQGDRITLGSGCQLQFRQPAAVSSSARLDLVSGHRLPLAVDGVLLMADTLLMGPGAHSHVVLPDAKESVILYRSKDGLGVRYAGDLTVDGRRVAEKAVLGPNAVVAGDEFAFAVEPLGTRMGRL